MMNFHYTLTTNEKNTNNRDSLQNVISSFWGKDNTKRNYLYAIRKTNNDFELDDVVRIELYCENAITNLDRKFKVEKERNDFQTLINMIKNGMTINIASEVNIVTFSKYKNNGKRNVLSNNTDVVDMKKSSNDCEIVSLNEFIVNKFKDCATNIVVKTNPSHDKKHFAKKSKDEKCWNINGTKFQATLTITDVDKLKSFINNGIYASKIYGFGLILFRIN